MKNADPESGVQALARRRALTLAYVLTIGTGAMDAIGFARLGDVFTSVMTGNLVLLGVSAGTNDGTLAINIGVAFASFVAGVMIGARLTASSRHTEVDATGFRAMWPAGINRALLLQLVLMVPFVIGWQLGDANPDGGLQVFLLVLAAAAMGLQSGAVLSIGLSGLSTTYVTGTLTNVLADLATKGRLRWSGVGTLTSLLAGAAFTGVLIAHAERYAVVLPTVALVVVLVLAARLRRQA